MDSILALLKLSSSWTRSTAQDASPLDSLGTKGSLVGRTLEKSKRVFRRDIPSRSGESSSPSEDVTSTSKDLESIMANVRSKANEFLDGIENCRLVMLKNTNSNTEKTLREVRYTRQTAVETKSMVSSLIAGHEAQASKFRVNFDQMRDYMIRNLGLNVRENLVEMLHEERKSECLLAVEGI